MKKSTLGLAVSAFFMVSAAQAAVSPYDVSATLSVVGTVTPAEAGCAVNTSVNNVVLNTDVTKLKDQQSIQTANDLTTVDLTVVGDTCSDQVQQGKIAYVFKGAADGSVGMSLANTATGEGAATGVAIGLFDVMGKPININSQTVVAHEGITYLGLNLVKMTNAEETTTGNVQGSLTIQIERL